MARKRVKPLRIENPTSAVELVEGWSSDPTETLPSGWSALVGRDDVEVILSRGRGDEVSLRGKVVAVDLHGVWFDVGNGEAQYLSFRLLPAVRVFLSHREEAQADD